MHNNQSFLWIMSKKKGQEFADNIYFSVYSQDLYVVLLC